ncbi:MBL fold metallo-hydrolase [Alcaligenaceae bacterium]|nr:MBL fold metallo-hydrolase [Alcaligenaceae bacterium]
MRLSFLGTTREATGSCVLVEAAGMRFLVNCGMVRGGCEVTAHNHQPFAFDPSQIDFVLLSHAHIDHSGLLPKLARAGFKGPIYTTEATVELLGVMLLNSADIQECDAKYQTEHPVRQHPLSMLYTRQDAHKSLAQVRGIPYNHEFEPHKAVRCRLRDAGHTIGSAIIEIWVSEYGLATKLVFSGDLGQPGRTTVRQPTPIDEADILVIASTYGNRRHKSLAAVEDEMIAIIDQTLFKRSGNVIMPAFAVGHTQEVIYHLQRLTREGRLQQPEIFVDSSMATDAMRITRKSIDQFDDQRKHCAGHLTWDKGWSHLRCLSTMMSVFFMPRDSIL